MVLSLFTLLPAVQPRRPRKMPLAIGAGELRAGLTHRESSLAILPSQPRYDEDS